MPKHARIKNRSPKFNNKEQGNKKIVKIKYFPGIFRDLRLYLKWRGNRKKAGTENSGKNPISTLLSSDKEDDFCGVSKSFPD